MAGDPFNRFTDAIGRIVSPARDASIAPIAPSATAHSPPLAASRSARAGDAKAEQDAALRRPRPRAGSSPRPPRVNPAPPGSRSSATPPSSPPGRPAITWLNCVRQPRGTIMICILSAVDPVASCCCRFAVQRLGQPIAVGERARPLPIRAGTCRSLIELTKISSCGSGTLGILLGSIWPLPVCRDRHAAGQEVRRRPEAPGQHQEDQDHHHDVHQRRHVGPRVVVNGFRAFEFHVELRWDRRLPDAGLSRLQVSTSTRHHVSTLLLRREVHVRSRRASRTPAAPAGACA